MFTSNYPEILDCGCFIYYDDKGMVKRKNYCQSHEMFNMILEIKNDIKLIKDKLSSTSK